MESGGAIECQTEDEFGGNAGTAILLRVVDDALPTAQRKHSYLHIACDSVYPPNEVRGCAACVPGEHV